MNRTINLMRRLKMSHLRLLDSIGQTNNLTRTSEKIAMSQPAVSRLLREIELIVGAPLFERIPKGMVATGLGEIMIRRARQALLELGKAESEVEELLAGYGTTIKVGAVTAPAIDLAIRAIRDFQNEHEKLRIVLEIGTSGPLIKALLDGQFDFIFARAPHDLQNGKLNARHIRAEQAIFLVRDKHPLLGTERSLSDAINYPWIMEPEGSLLRNRVESEFRNSNLPLPTKILSTSSLLINLAAIKQSDAIAVVSGAVLKVVGEKNGFQRLQLKGLDRDFLVPPFELIRHKERILSPLAEKLYQKISDLC